LIPPSIPKNIKIEKNNNQPTHKIKDSSQQQKGSKYSNMK